MFQRLAFIISTCTVLFIAGCIPSPYYQKDYTIPQGKWTSQFRPSFKFEITDTASTYNMYFLIRHTETYPYSNIWLHIYTRQPGDSAFKESRIEIPLADPSGKWLGKGMGEIWEHRMPMTGNDNAMFFAKPGKYEIKFEQNMRVNPLPEVLQVGLRIEKTGRQAQNKRQ